MSYIVVAYYTEKTGYEIEAQNLIKSLVKFNLPHEVVPIPNQGNWQANTQYKPYFIKQMLLRHFPKDLLYLDVDAIVQREPVLFDHFTYDIGVHYMHNVELISSTVYLANNPRIFALVERWNHGCLMEPSIWDQKILQAAINNSRDLRLKVCNLPPEYCKIYDLMHIIKDPVIEQFQASTRLRKEIDRPQPQT